MKKGKLNFEKLRIARINNLSNVQGGAEVKFSGSEVGHDGGRESVEGGNGGCRSERCILI